ncbi:hypothetical protein [Kordiimonas sp.]|uniref:hypothetical protein n=1 Tax=Kordiimonas sp. TaxID=1970157 RepID=UPI003B52B6A8
MRYWTVVSSMLLFLAIVVPTADVDAQDHLTICEFDPIPEDYLVVQRAIPWSPCGKQTAMKLRKLGPKEMTVCDGTPQRQVPPPNYHVVIKNIPSGICGSWRKGPATWEPWTAIRIRNIH